MPAKKEKLVKEKKPEALFKVEFWEENNEQTPLRTEYVPAPIESTWEATRKGVIRMMQWRGYGQARQQDKVWLSHLLARQDVLVTIKVDEKWAAKKKEEQDLKDQSHQVEIQTKQLEKQHKCKKCGGELDDDYCQSCGWRRQSWVERAMAKQGEASPNGEL